MSASKIAIVTDSSAYIPDTILNGLNIHVIPLCLIWDNEELQDGVDILPEAFYKRLRSSKTLPTTSQPNPVEFEEFFHCLESDCSAIVNVLVSSKISGTITSARAAKEKFSEFPVEIVDSRTSSMGLGFVVLAAARAAAAGNSVEEVIAAAMKMREEVKLLFVVDTLEYLHRGGRISIAKRYLGAALQIKPILHFNNATIEPLSQARTKKKAINLMLDLAEEQLEGRGMEEAAIVNIDCHEEAENLAKLVQARFAPTTMFHANVSPVVGTQVGPGGLGVAFYPRN
jgi:DegV family protein with EDD domain